MFLSSLGRSFSLVGGSTARSRRRVKPLAPRAAEILESRLLLAATLFVDPASSNPAVFHTIQSAVNAASAGDTIDVAPGHYNEDATVPISLNIQGGQPQLPGESGASSLKFEAIGFDVSASNVTIQGFTIQPNPASTATPPLLAIYAVGSDSSTFDNNIIKNSELLLDGVSNSNIANNSGTFDIEAINFASTAPDINDTFTDNTMPGGSIFLNDTASGATLTGNTLNGGLFESLADNETFVDNTSNNGGGFDQFGGNNCIYIGNVANNGGGFDLAPTTGGPITLIGNTADNDDVGIDVFGGGTYTLMNNTANKDSFGIQLFGPDDASSILSNTANNNLNDGFDIFGDSPTVTGNVANGDGGTGITVNGVSPTINNNTANNAGISGFSLNNDSPTVSGNTANGAGEFGFSISSDADATISGNTANNGTGSGFSIAAGGPLTLTDNVARKDAGYGFEIAMQERHAQRQRRQRRRQRLLGCSSKHFVPQ